MSSENNSSSGSKKKIVAAAVAVALAAVMLIGGTISYLTASSDTVINNFNSPELEVDVTETTGDDYTIIPNTSEKKDPYVYVTSTLDYAYVYLFVVDETDGLVTYEIADDWILLYDNATTDSNGNEITSDSSSYNAFTGTNTKVYYRVASEGTSSFQVLKNDTVSYSKDITYSDLYDEDGNLRDGFTLSFYSLAIQTDSFSSAADAFSSLCTVASDSESLTTALESGGIIVVTDDITLTAEDSGTSGGNAYLTASADTTLILADYTLSFDTSSLSDNELAGNLTDTPILIAVEDGATLTIESGTFDCTVGSNSAYAIDVVDGDLIINGGTFYGAPSAVQVESGTATIYGGTFDFTDACKESSSFSSYLANYLLNCIDTAYKNGSASITVYGGTYVSFNPADNSAENANTSFVASGYTVTSSTNDDGETVYTVDADSSSSE